MITLEYDPEDKCVTQDTSARIKTALKKHFTRHGLPNNAAEINDLELSKMATQHFLEFEEAMAEFAGVTSPTRQ